MIIELAAHRVLAPLFGNSLYTWTGLIGIILLAMSCGYYLGGWLADKNTDYVTLAHLLTAAAFLILIVPLLQSFFVSKFYVQNEIIWGPVWASLLLFALPGCALGSIPPFVVRLISLLSVDKHIGVSAGAVGMLSTAGSVFGTFMAGFVLIPLMGIKTIFWTIGAILALLSIIGYIFFLSKGKSVGLAVFLSGCLIIFMTTFFSKIPLSVLFDRQTFYHRIRVIQENYAGGRVKNLYLDTVFHGGQYENSKEFSLSYQRFWELVKLICPQIDHAVFLGGGAFTMPEALLDAYPKAKVDVVEIDPMVIETGRMFFRVNAYPQMNVMADDARRYLRLCDRKYDLIFGDVYYGMQYIPPHLITAEFFSIVRKRLHKNGIYMMNIIGSISGEQPNLILSVVKTIRKSFQNVYLFTEQPNNLELRDNVIIVASNREVSLKLPDKLHKAERERLQKLLAAYIPPEKYNITNASLFTDDHNPIEYIVAKNITRKGEYIVYKELIY